ncbi:MAG: pyridoxal-phosphate dependent enzyme [bacterium]|nr:pyridoxal-phosphate dependent enzyme [bacterium]
MFSKTPNSPIQWISDPLLDEKGVRLAIKREDLIHPHISGNKWRKLKYNFLEAKEKGYTKVLTFGGAFSNHITATSACAKEFGLESVGVIRGEELNSNSNHTLRFASNQGMSLSFVSRSDYRNKSNDDFIETLKSRFGEFFLIPEGGTNDLAIKGTEEILGNECKSFSHVCVAAGTGGTASGIIRSANLNQHILVFPALKGNFMESAIKSLVGVGEFAAWTSLNQYHFGGYAKWNDELIDFINSFNRQYNIPLDPIYTGKMLFGLFDMIKRDYFVKEATLLAIHTGGLQGIQGFNDQYNNILI